MIATKQALRNALIPVATYTGLVLAGFLGGAVVIESIFNWQGIGQTTLNAVQDRDYPLIQGAVIVVAACFIIVNFIVDLLYLVIDPRIRYQGPRSPRMIAIDDADRAQPSRPWRGSAPGCVAGASPSSAWRSLGCSSPRRYSRRSSPPSRRSRSILPMRRKRPFFMKGGSTAHLLGTDNLGRDILSRVIYGSRTTLGLAAIVLVVGAVIGVSVGLASGYLGGITDIIVQRLVEAILSLPTIMVALVFAFLLGQSFTTVVIILAPFIAARFARMVRGDVLAIRGTAYVELAQVAGASTFRIIRKHILPNVVSTIIVIATLEIGQLILLEASLSFLGVGVPPPTPEWGLMVSEGEQFLATQVLDQPVPRPGHRGAVLAINLIGDWLRDYLDPKRSERG